MPSFRHKGHKLTYDAFGTGDRPLVLIHGLLMNRHMFDGLAAELADRGNKVICLDLLGHGDSDRPADMTTYSMQLFAEQVVALLDHLELDDAVVGGTSLGANVGLETTALAPERVRAMFIEMPVLDNALLGVAMFFSPILMALRFGQPAMKGLAQLTRRIPRSVHLADIALDWVRQDPEPSVAVLEGLFFGRTAPHHDVRATFEQPALIIGHPADPLHPFTDADMLARELKNSRLVDANSIFEWRVNPSRLNDELAGFLDEVWAKPKRRAVKRASKAPKKRRSSSARASRDGKGNVRSAGRRTAAKRSK